MVTAYIGLGSNLDHPQTQLRQAIDAIAVLPGCRRLALSSLYRSRPLGPQDQPDYINAVMAIETTLAPLALLDELQAIEQAQGRVRGAERWGPRTLDLDLLLYAAEEYDAPRLKIPHPGLHERSFVLYPLYEIAPALVIPGRGALVELLAHCRNDLDVISDAS
ncbi:MAG: 2-amino-4-hydroxy-6-hydroxymethyldihydropteridine diphosphokinase [Gammaproteobacteria bacterium]